MATVTDRPRILAALHDLTWRAGRMTCVDEDYAGVHESINRWLDELERLQASGGDDGERSQGGV